MPKTIITTGTSVAFATSGFAMNIDSIEPPNSSREAINTSHLGTTSSHTFTPSDLVDNGELNFNGHFDPDLVPPRNGAAEQITITWPLESGESTAATWVFSGFLTNYQPTGSNEEKATCTATFKITGDITQNAAS